MKLNRRNFIIGSIAVSAPISLPSKAAVTDFNNDLELIISKSLERIETEAELTSDWLYIFEEEVSFYMKDVWKNHKPLIQHSIKDSDGKAIFINLWEDPNFYEDYHIGGQISISKWGYDIDEDQVAIDTAGFVSAFDHPYLDHVKVRCNYQYDSNEIRIDFEAKEKV